MIPSKCSFPLSSVWPDSMRVSYEFPDPAHMGKRIPADYEWFQNFLKKPQAKKEGG